MATTINAFISHIHEDDELVSGIKDLVGNTGIDLRNYAITSDKPNNAKDEDYIKSKYLIPRIKASSVVLVLITAQTAKSWWVNWEIEYAAQGGKRIVGVFAQGAQDADVPEALDKYGDALVGWQGGRVVDAIKGDCSDWVSPTSGELRPVKWPVARQPCQ